MIARGTFDVTITPAEAPDPAAPLARMKIDKRFRGDLDGPSRGEMLAAGTNVKGSAGYVAIERVDGVLHGRTGSFVLQHSGTMARGAGSMDVSIVPDSGTGGLEGIAGRMEITIAADGTHAYALTYRFETA